MTFIFSLNLWGLGAAPKFLALKDCFSTNRPFIILLQETMHTAPQVIGYFQIMLPDWHMVATDANGHSRGLIAIWDLRWVKLRDFSCFSKILLSGHIHGLLGCIHILNIYAPYHDHESFWQWLVALELLELTSLILVGDLNRIFGAHESWGRSC